MSVPQFRNEQILLLLGGIILIHGDFSSVMTLIMLSAIPPVIVLAVLFGRKMRKNSRDAQDKLAPGTGIIVEETLQGIFNVKAFVNEAFEIARYGRSMDTYIRLAMKGANLRGAFIAFIVFALFGCIMVVLWSGASMLQSGSITIGKMTRFVLYVRLLSRGPWVNLPILSAKFKEPWELPHRVQELLQERPEFTVSENATMPSPPREAFRGEVEFP